MKRRSVCLVILLLLLLAISLSIPLGLVSVEVPATTTGTETTTTTSTPTTTPTPCMEDFSFSFPDTNFLTSYGFVRDKDRNAFFTVVKDTASTVKIYSSIGWNASLPLQNTRIVTMVQNTTNGDLFVQYTVSMSSPSVLSKYNISGQLLWSIAAASIDLGDRLYIDYTREVLVTASGEVRRTSDGSLIRTNERFEIAIPFDNVFYGVSHVWEGPYRFNVSKINVDTGMMEQTITYLFQSPDDIVGTAGIDSTGNLYVTTTNYCDEAILKFDPNLNFLWKTNFPSSCTERPWLGFWLFYQTGSFQYDVSTDRIYQVTLGYHDDLLTDYLYIFALEPQTGTILNNVSIPSPIHMTLDFPIQEDFQHRKLYVLMTGLTEYSQGFAIEIRDICLP